MAYWYAVAAGVSIYNQYQQSRAAEAYARDQAAIAEIQAQIALENAEYNAKKQRELGQEQSVEQRRQSRLQVGATVAQTAGAGVEISDSPMMLIGSQIRTGEMSAAKLMTNASAKASGELARGRAQAAGFQATAAAQEARADDIQGSRLLNLIATGANYAAGYYSMTGESPFSYGEGGNPAPEWDQYGYSDYSL